VARLSSALPPSAYGDAFADVYDDWYPADPEGEGAVDLIIRLAGGGAVLELGVGTGRLACAIAARGVQVWGVDASPAMLDRLAAKPGPVVTSVCQDIAQLTLSAAAPQFAVVLIAFNTIFCLASDDEQRACLEGAAAMLIESGRMVVEAFVPSVPVLPRHGQVEVARISDDRLVLKVSKWVADEELVRGHHVEMSSTGIRLRPWQLHPVGPERLDELASAATLELEARYADWRCAPFGPSSLQHVSIYRRVPT
jgi:SAM-dependent methyltransferase